MTIKFEKLVPTNSQIDELFTLLSNRRYSISHKTKPSKRAHNSFVSGHPYVVWYLLYKNESSIGSVYIHFDNSIGLNLIDFNEEDVLSIIDRIKNEHSPLPSKKSERRGEFFLNVSSDNKPLIKVLNNLTKIEFQRSFII